MPIRLEDTGEEMSKEQQGATPMNQPMSNVHFKLMSLGFMLRDVFLPRRNIVRKVGIKPGFTVLDYGCGTGSYSIPTAEIVGESGRVYALDIHPLGVQRVERCASKKGLANIETILSDCTTGLPDGAVDIVLLFDTLHALGNPHEVLEELHRVLKSGGICCVSDHHMKEEEILSEVTKRGLFRLLNKGNKTYRFLKEEC
jgi:ubiquinone/menaquinone biosynthesis C-methylase UbiE